MAWPLLERARLDHPLYTQRSNAAVAPPPSAPPHFWPPSAPPPLARSSNTQRQGSPSRHRPQRNCVRTQRWARPQEEATAAIALNGLALAGNALHFQRPRAYVGPADVVPGGGSMAAAASGGAAAAAALLGGAAAAPLVPNPVASVPSTCLQLCNMVSLPDLQDDEESGFIIEVARPHPCRHRNRLIVGDPHDLSLIQTEGSLTRLVPHPRHSATDS